MGLWTRISDYARTPLRKLVAEVSAAYLEELRLARQLRLHAERVPYPNLGVTLLGLGDREDAHATLLHAELTRLGSPPKTCDGGPTRGGRNSWERLSFDLQDMRTKIKRYMEMSQRWDIEYPDTAALFGHLANEETAMCRVLGELIARSDPHAAN